MAFRGWKVEALEFFEGLEVDNSKSYWQAHKGVYDDVVRAPMEELLAELEPDFGEGRIFRPYRDIRFSKDKSPYKTAIGATVGDGYVQLDARGLAAGSGMGDGARPVGALPGGGRRRPIRLEDRADRVVGTSRRPGGHWPRRAEDRPKGYPKDHPRIELLRYKGLTTWREWPAGAWLGTKRAGSDRRVPRAVEAGRRMAPRARRPFDDAGARPSLTCGSLG